MELVNYLVMT